MKVTQNLTTNAQGVDSSRPAEKTNSSAKSKRAQTAPISSQTTDATVQISDDARLFNQALEVTKQSPDIRRDRVEALKKSIQNGTYKVDSQAVADRLLEEHLGTDFGKNNL